MNKFALFCLCVLGGTLSSCGAISRAEEAAIDGVDEAKAWAWIVNEELSTLSFSGTQTGKEFSGVFEKFDANIVLDPENLLDAHIEIEVDLNSANTADRQRDAAIPGPDWFDVKNFPAAKFISNEINKQDDGSFNATGELSIRGVTKEVSLPFSLSINGEKALAEGSMSLIRSDFGIGQGEFSTGQWVGLDVKIAYKIVADR